MKVKAHFLSVVISLMLTSFFLMPAWCRPKKIPGVKCIKCAGPLRLKN